MIRYVIEVEIMLIQIKYGHRIILDIKFNPNVEGGTFRVESMRQHLVWQPRGIVNHLTLQYQGVLYYVSTPKAKNAIATQSFILWTL